MSRSDRIVVAAAGGALLLALAAVAVLLLPPDGAHDDSTALLVATPPVAGESTPAATASSGAASVVVDVAGAVVRPGLVELAVGARVGDAIAAAGGYATDADLDAATRSLNLAQHLGDGEQVRVPRIGETAAASGGGGTGGEGSAPGAPVAGGGASAGSGGGLVNLNTATPEELEALPGIGPVTVQKIVAARQERPFASLEDAQQRGVIHRGQLEDIRELATAG
jgi:competence protein ComEA